MGPDILVGLVPGEETNLDNGVEAPSEVDELRCSGSDVAVGLATFEDAERGTSRFGLTCSSIEVNRTADGPRVRFGTRYLVRPQTSRARRRPSAPTAWAGLCSPTSRRPSTRA